MHTTVPAVADESGLLRRWSTSVTGVKYMLQIHADTAGFDAMPLHWSAEDMRIMIAYMTALDADLRATGELLDDNGFGGAAQVHTVQAGAMGDATVTAGLRAGATTFLVGYWIIDVASFERAVEIATLISVTPGPGGAPVNQPVEIHPVGAPPDVS